MFQGKDQVMVGIGEKIFISHVGNVLLPFFSSPFTLKHIFHTLTLSNNLLSVIKLYYDNRVFVEFYPNYFLVKEVIKKVPLQGQLDHGLNRVQPISFSLISTTP